MVEIINLGSLQLRFLQSKDDTAGSLDMFEMTLQPNARMPIPHYHESWDETIYGLTGTTTWRVDGKDIDLTSGETVFIKRGIVHGFTNRTSEPATCLCTLSPGVIGPQYFRDMAALLAAGAPDPAQDEANDAALWADTRALDVPRARSGLDRREHREPLTRASQIQHIGIGGLRSCTTSTRADTGPRRHNATMFDTTSEGPANSASTLPSLRLRTQPSR